MTPRPMAVSPETGPIPYSVVIPTVLRPSLWELLHTLEATAWQAPGQAPDEVVLVVDRPGGDAEVQAVRTEARQRVGTLPMRPVVTGGRGPAAARNLGWRLARNDWVVFLDDDVLLTSDWAQGLQSDLAALPETVAGSQARLSVPLKPGRRPTDAERGTVALETARWITADMAYRRSALAAVGGFDQRFGRAYREDADIALRLHRAGYRIATGRRRTLHPPRPSGFFASVRAQRGNADDALMRRRHGRDWRADIGEGQGRIRLHTATTLAAAGALLGSPKTGSRRTAALAGLGWLASTAQFAAIRIAPGPRTPDEIARMAVTSALIPPVAVWHRLRGEIAARRRPPDIEAPPLAVLFDRDDTLIDDVPYLDDPELVRPVAGAEAALKDLRAAGLRLGIVSNQSGVAKGLITPDRLRAVNAAVEQALGPFDTWQVCVHDDGDGCGCRKPADGLVHSAAAELGVPAARCVVIGDTGADVGAAERAGARGILVPTSRTRPEEVDHARTHARVAGTVREAVRLVLEDS